MNNLKDPLARFRSWQKEPRYYSDQDLKDHRCANCGYEFKGNYCPVCGQGFDEGEITWESVWNNFTSVWDLDSRSLPSSIWHLIWRPGYFIGDYISGHKQVSHPPANLLFTVAVIYIIILQIFGVNIDFTFEGETGMHAFEWIAKWLTEHPAWNMMSFTVCMILPTWALFRHAPRHHHHTLPQSVFIQLLMSTLMMVCSLFANISAWFNLLIPFYYIVTYRQLFGYSTWGTIWRLMICSIIWLNNIFFFCCMMLLIDNPTSAPTYAIILMSFAVLLVAFIMLFIGYIISKRTSKK
ncbi:MAG: DUF3667 domain-containing protein [Bacteroidales bacterium]|nr:DUF3667 domain-containing protein [Bacteroidales bacterium]